MKAQGNEGKFNWDINLLFFKITATISTAKKGKYKIILSYYVAENVLLLAQAADSQMHAYDFCAK